MQTRGLKSWVAPAETISAIAVVFSLSTSDSKYDALQLSLNWTFKQNF